MFFFVNAEGKAHSIDTEDTVYYLIDVDMPKVLHEVDEQYRQKFKIREILVEGLDAGRAEERNNVVKNFSKVR